MMRHPAGILAIAALALVAGGVARAQLAIVPEVLTLNLGDVNGDGVADFVFQHIPGNGYTTGSSIVSGADFSVIREVELEGAVGGEVPHELVRIPDRTGDGVDDLAITTFGDSRISRLYIYDPVTALTIDSTSVRQPNSQSIGPLMLTPWFDFDTDGVVDLAVGDPELSIGGQANAGIVYIISGKDLEPITAITRPEGDTRTGFGSYLFNAGELDVFPGPELLVSRVFENKVFVVSSGSAIITSEIVSPYCNNNNCSQIYFPVDEFRGVDGQPLICFMSNEYRAGTFVHLYDVDSAMFVKTIEGDPAHPWSIPYSIDVPDVDGDGKEDLLISDTNLVKPELAFYSTKDYKLIRYFFEKNAGNQFGYAHTIPDRTGDGVDDLAVVDYTETGGRTFIYAFPPWSEANQMRASWILY